MMPFTAISFLYTVFLSHNSEQVRAANRGTAHTVLSISLCVQLQPPQMLGLKMFFYTAFRLCQKELELINMGCEKNSNFLKTLVQRPFYFKFLAQYLAHIAGTQNI